MPAPRSAQRHDRPPGATTLRLLRSLAHAFSAAGLAGFLLTAPAAAEPAMWVARDSDSTVYLFGTFHVLPPGTGWRTARLDEALASADELWLEIDFEKHGNGFTTLLRYGTSPHRPLSSRVPPADFDALRHATEFVGLPISAIEKMQPWLAAMGIEQTFLRKVGFVDDGADSLLAESARELGIPIQGLETADQQLRMFADLSEATGLFYLRETVSKIESGSVELNEMLDAWLDGDLDRLDPRFEITRLGPLRPDETTAWEEFYRTLMLNRNRAMSERITEVMAGAGTHFVAVGAAHLAGSDSIQRFLADKGIVAERVQ